MYPIPLFVLDILPSLSYVQGDEPYPAPVHMIVP
jgi:hypothetical protein